METDRKWTDLEFTGKQEILHNGFKITNTEKGLLISRNGKRLMFFKNAFGLEGEYGYFGFRPLLGRAKNQLVYLSRTGGNHCCAYFQIADLSTKRPAKIFNSEDFDVQMGESEGDSLMTFDRESDGKLEITQKTSFGWGMDCAEASRPTIYVGFSYDEKLRNYLPMKDFAPNTRDWVERMKADVLEDNRLIEKGQFLGKPPCEYESNITGVALNYIYIGKANIGYRYIRENYRALNYDIVPLRFDKKYSQRTTIQTVANIKKTLSYDKLYRAIYKK